MTINKEMYENIIRERDEIISRLEEDLELQIDKLDKLADQVIIIKTAIKDFMPLIDHVDNDHFIASTTNFLAEAGEEYLAQVFSKCKFGGIHISEVVDRSHEQGTIISYRYKIRIHIFCSGDAFQILDSIKDEYFVLKPAIDAFFSLTYVEALYRKEFGDLPPMDYRPNKVEIDLDLATKRIKPQELDIELFFEKVDSLKKLLKDK